MDSHHAIVIGKEEVEKGNFVVLGRVNNPGPDKNTNENAEHNNEIALRHKFFKEIAAIMVNIDEIHVTGTGQAQEQFIKFLAETAQYKNVEASESTSVKMVDDELIAFVKDHFK